MSLPSKEQALAFAIMLQAGLPASEAILYFAETDDPTDVAYQLQDWQRSAAVKRAVGSLMGKSWTDMNLDEKIHCALELHYAGLAHFLFSHNYADLAGTDKTKADTARMALEAKLAGTAGKTDALSQFFDDINSGKVKLTKPSLPLLIPPRN